MIESIKNILNKEKTRQDTTIELIASENFASQAVMDLCGSIFTNKYAEGYPSKRYYNGCEHMDEIEQLAIDQLKNIYKCNYELRFFLWHRIFTGKSRFRKPQSKPLVCAWLYVMFFLILTLSSSYIA